MQTPDFEALAQPGIRGLRAYDPGHDIVALRRKFAGRVLVELGSNENPLGPSPRVADALLACLPELHRYPDPLGAGLKHALADRHGLQTAQILLGNGSHELLMMLGQVFAGPAASVLASQYGFAVYAIAAQAAGAPFTAAAALPATAEMPRGHDLDAMAAAIGPTTRMVYLANPNNPTGTWLETAALAQFLARVPSSVLVVVDEAYIEYSTDPALVSALSLLPRFPNLVVTRTFSKAHGLAGLRVGYVCADSRLVQVVERVRESFNVGTPGLVGAVAALGDELHLKSVALANAEERQWLAAELRSRALQVAPSQTNFLLVDFQRDASAIESGLVQQGIVLRPMIGYGLPTCLRITVGTRAENLRLLEALDRVLE